MLFAQAFEEQFEDWLIDGSLSTIGFTVMVLLLVALVVWVVSR